MMTEEIKVLSDIIKRRRSVFPVSYTAQEIPVEVIQQILESANYAPTHKLTEPWRFRVFIKEGKNRLGTELARIYQASTTEDTFLQKKYDNFVTKANQAGCIIVLTAQLNPALLPEWEEVAALACAVQNMALTAEALEVGTYWSSPGMIKHMNDFLGLEENEKCFGLFYMGYHDHQPRVAKRTPMAHKVKWIEE